MLGVVLWSDPSERKAVIWCEDHGDLAYFSDSDGAATEMPEIDAGDLVDFDLCQDTHLRRARNPRRIDQGAYDGIASRLQVASSCPQPVAANQQQTVAQVIPFKRERAEAPARALVVV